MLHRSLRFIATYVLDYRKLLATSLPSQLIVSFLLLFLKFVIRYIRKYT